MSTTFQTAALEAVGCRPEAVGHRQKPPAYSLKSPVCPPCPPGWLRHVSQLPIGADPCPFTVLIDTREQAAWRFDEFTTDQSKSGAAVRPLFVPCRFQGLATGDYSIETADGVSLADQIVIERKSLADLYGTLGAGRERFAAEHERMAEIVARGGYACVVIEATLEQAVSEPPEGSKLNPKTVFRTAASWQVKYGTPWHFVGPRRLAEAFAFRVLEKWIGRKDRENP